MWMVFTFVALFVSWASIFMYGIKKTFSYSHSIEFPVVRIPVLTHILCLQYNYYLKFLWLSGIVSIGAGIFMWAILRDTLAFVLILPSAIITIAAFSIYQKSMRKVIFYVEIVGDDFVCLNGKKKVISIFPKERIKGVRVRDISYKTLSRYANDAQHRFIVLLFKGGDLCRTLGIYDEKETLTNHYMLIAYTPETLEILKKHLDVPVIVEDEE